LAEFTPSLSLPPCLSRLLFGWLCVLGIALPVEAEDPGPPDHIHEAIESVMLQLLGVHSVLVEGYNGKKDGQLFLDRGDKVLKEGRQPEVKHG